MHGTYPSPFREVDWRARRCEDLIEHGKRPSRSHDDRWTWVGWRFFHALAQSDADRHCEGVRRRWPHLARAVELHRDADHWKLEAWLLAREPIATVARRFGLAAEAIEWYCRLFFDVLDTLDARYYILWRAVGVSPSRALNEGDAASFCKLFAYFSGPLVLDVVLDDFSSPESVPANITQITPSRLPRVARHLCVRAAIAARCAPAGDPRPVELLRLAERLRALVPDGCSLADEIPVDSLGCDGEQDHSAKVTEPVIQQRRAG